MKAEEFSKLSLHELEVLLMQYPFLSIARKYLTIKMSSLGDEQRESALRKSIIYLSKPENLLFSLPGLSNTNIAPVANKDVPLSRTIIVGGDYFSRQDFESLDNTEFRQVEEIPSKENTDDKLANSKSLECQYYTETLARVYAQQQIYDKAIEIYEKLILLYPEKSIYFASHIDGLKKNL